MSNNRDALGIAQSYIEAVEEQDLDRIAPLLDESVRHVFPMAGGGWAGIGAIYDGKSEVLDYLSGLFDVFASLRWIEKEWTASADGKRVFLEAKSDGVVAGSNAPYINTYVIRIDIRDGSITGILEYAISELYLALGLEPADAMKTAIERAQGLPEKASATKVVTA